MHMIVHINNSTSIPSILHNCTLITLANSLNNAMDVHVSTSKSSSRSAPPK